MKQFSLDPMQSIGSVGFSRAFGVIGSLVRVLATIPPSALVKKKRNCHKL
jgi:hypothetical protein